MRCILTLNGVGWVRIVLSEYFNVMYILSFFGVGYLSTVSWILLYIEKLITLCSRSLPWVLWALILTTTLLSCVDRAIERCSEDYLDWYSSGLCYPDQCSGHLNTLLSEPQFTRIWALNHSGKYWIQQSAKYPDIRLVVRFRHGKY